MSNEGTAAAVAAQTAIAADDASGKQGAPLYARAVMFVGATAFITWRFSLLLTPMSPFFKEFLGSNLPAMVGAIAILAVPFVLTCIFCDYLMGALQSRVRLAISWTAMVLVFAVPNTWVQLVCLSVVLCLLHISYSIIFHVKSDAMKYFIGSYIVGGLLLVAEATFFISAFYLSIVALPIVTLACFSINYLGNYHKVTYLPQAESRKRLSFFVHNPVTTCGKAFISGLGTGCLFVALLADRDVLAAIGAVMVAIGIIAAIAQPLSKRVDSTVRIVELIVTFVPMLLLIPYASGWQLAALGVLGVVVGRASTVFNLKEGADAVKMNDAVELYFVGFDFLFGVLGSVAGLVVFYWLYTTAASTTAITWLCGATLFLFVLYTVVYQGLLVSQKDDMIFDEHAQLAIAESDNWAAKIEPLAKFYKLSPRQAEVMEYLARGRNADFIADHFVISKATAKSHIYAIYKKLHVHSQQELINLVEQRANRNS